VTREPQLRLASGAVQRRAMAASEFGSLAVVGRCNGDEVYNVSGGKSVPEWLSDKKKGRCAKTTVRPAPCRQPLFLEASVGEQSGTVGPQRVQALRILQDLHRTVGPPHKLGTLRRIGNGCTAKPQAVSCMAALSGASRSLKHCIA